MKFTASTDIDRLKDLDEVKKYVTLALEQLGQILNNNLSFGENFNAKTLTATFSAANTDLAMIHGLGRVPSGYIVVGANAAMSVYDGSSANTVQLLYLRSSAAGVARILVY